MKIDNSNILPREIFLHILDYVSLKDCIKFCNLSKLYCFYYKCKTFIIEKLLHDNGYNKKIIVKFVHQLPYETINVLYEKLICTSHTIFDINKIVYLFTIEQVSCDYYSFIINPINKCIFKNNNSDISCLLNKCNYNIFDYFVLPKIMVTEILQLCIKKQLNISTNIFKQFLDNFLRIQWDTNSFKNLVIDSIIHDNKIYYIELLDSIIQYKINDLDLADLNKLFKSTCLTYKIFYITEFLKFCSLNNYRVVVNSYIIQHLMKTKFYNHVCIIIKLYLKESINTNRYIRSLSKNFDNTDRNCLKILELLSDDKKTLLSKYIRLKLKIKDKGKNKYLR